MNRIPVLCLLSLLSIGPPPLAEGEARSRPSNEQLALRQVTLRHLDTKAAVTVARSVFQMRQIAELRPTRTLVLRDTPETLEAAARLLHELDVAPASWSVEVVLVTSAGERVLRTIALQQEDLEVRFGATADGFVRFDLEADDPGAASLGAEYEIALQLRSGEGKLPFHFREEGRDSFRDGDRLVLIEASLAEVRRSLAEVLGLDSEVHSVFLRFRQNDAGERRG